VAIKGMDNDLSFPSINGGAANAGSWDSDLSWTLGWITKPGDKEFINIPAGKYLMTVSPKEIDT